MYFTEFCCSHVQSLFSLICAHMLELSPEKFSLNCSVLKMPKTLGARL